MNHGSVPNVIPDMNLCMHIFTIKLKVMRTSELKGYILSINLAPSFNNVHKK